MRSVTALLLPSVAFALSAVSLASAAELEWNQERVAALAQDVVEHLEVIRADLEKRPHAPEEAAARASVMNDLERLVPRARELAERLASGAGRAETAALFRDVEALGDQAAKHSHEYPARFEMHVHIDQVQTITIQLARYYGETSGSGDEPHR
jgi:hypothetical protein